jgi:hypothetical protein
VHIVNYSLCVQCVGVWNRMSGTIRRLQLASLICRCAFACLNFGWNIVDKRLPSVAVAVVFVVIVHIKPNCVVDCYIAGQGSYSSGSFSEISDYELDHLQLGHLFVTVCNCEL